MKKLKIPTSRRVRIRLSAAQGKSIIDFFAKTHIEAEYLRRMIRLRLGVSQQRTDRPEFGSLYWDSADNPIIPLFGPVVAPEAIVVRLSAIPWFIHKSLRVPYTAGIRLDNKRWIRWRWGMDYVAFGKILRPKDRNWHNLDPNNWIQSSRRAIKCAGFYEEVTL